ncbi:MAG: hypothetical protein H6822_08685 [Planctomycetaceae bacterium]|nr:hypothetical protein [Planctomycetales bacterium]MCB9922244.1 hypothetical protein [Planctomycetaceae bacterium]
MFRLFTCILIIASVAALATTRQTVLAAEPNRAAGDPPEGFGGKSGGGAEGRTVVVTTLADGGPGSLRAALALQEPRTIVFAVEGTITLKTRLRCTHGRVTIDAGSAPGAGITLLNHGIQFRGDCDDIIIRNLRIRVLTGGAEGDCLLFWGNDGHTIERVLIDHCSLMWATDEVLNTWGDVRNLTCQWTLLAEAQLPHSKGWLSGVGSDRISIHHCLFAQSADRNPKLEGGTYDVVNNVICNWSVNNAAKIEKGAHVNFVNNTFVAGPQSSASKGCVFPRDVTAGTRVFVAGNVAPLTPLGTEDPWLNVTSYEEVGGTSVERRPAPTTYRASTRFPAEPIDTQSAGDAYKSVLARVGAKVRDADDQRVIQNVVDRSGNLGRQQP